MSYQTWLSGYRSRGGVAERTAAGGSTFHRSATASDAARTTREDGSCDGTESLLCHECELPAERPGKESE